MSYGFQVRAASKAEAKQAVAAKFAEIVAQQPVHARDQAAVLANADAVIDLLQDDDSKDVSVSCNGYLSYTGEQAEPTVTHAKVECYAQHADRE